MFVTFYDNRQEILGKITFASLRGYPLVISVTGLSPSATHRPWLYGRYLPIME
ncbi:hypothetical protein HMPREF0580_0722 [Mobiluncus mulieris ATCC 35239]|uniref:Uncharacterized protein n=1 Tax=Mobiluncus mulieris ATCC 35239 TaxID=871571 RepID=E0QPA7_9ACTO|nr:hypothetical protein HMPREF0577_0089 [Mobiluncus mulieris ATCC 35243]EFM46674.1 hypothetical protein HMPREF0580_0722 [Mobiluncus mulieris ATCC 35239]